MSSHQPRTPAEIAENRRIAMEKLNEKRQRQNQRPDEVPLPPQQLEFIQQQIALTNEQKLKIEHNRLAAIEKAKQRGISPGKATSPSKIAVTNGRLNPYLNPPKSKNPLTVQNPVKAADGPRPSTSSGSSGVMKQTKLDKSIIISTEIVSEDRFSVKTDRYDENVINELKKIRSKVYNSQDKTWTFLISDYESFTRLFTPHPLRTIHHIPSFTLRLMRRPIESITESQLQQKIESKLYDSLFPFQRDGVLYGISRCGRFLLGDDMGLGKTFQALAVADYYKQEWPLLIVTTNAVRDMWADKIYEFMPSVNCLQIVVIKNQKSDMIADAKIVIVAYSILEACQKRLEAKNFGVVIFDESHNLKNPKAKQTSTATSLGRKAKRVILISGTPALSRPAELQAQLAILDRSVEYYAFNNRYCDGKTTNFGYQAQGATNMTELSILLNKSFMIRRMKQDVKFESSEKTREKVELKDFKPTKDDVKGMKEFKDKFTSVAGRKQAQHEILINWYATTAAVKAPAVCHYIKNALTNEPNEKFLIFGFHHVLMDAISTMLSANKTKFIRIDGQTKTDVRNSLVNQFQSDASLRCAILSIKACSAGITLTAASKVIFAELDWTPSNILQAEARAHRIGQEKDVKVTFLIASGTADDVLWKMLQSKQQQLDQIGLVGVNEHLADKETKNSVYESRPSPSTSKSGTIDKFFKRTSTENVAESPSKPQDDDDDSLEGYKYFTALEEWSDQDETLNDVDIDLAAIDEIERATKRRADECEASADANETDDIDFAALEEIENAAKKPKIDDTRNVEQKKAEIAEEILKDIDLDEMFD